MSKAIDWSTLKLPEYETDAETRSRLESLTAQLLKANGLNTEPKGNSPGFKPTVDQARQVATMSCMGLSAKEIACVLDVEVKLLKMFYSKELEASALVANAMVARKALSMAMSGKSADMTKFWLKARAGWKETSVTEVTGKDGGPVDISTPKDRLKRLLDATKAKQG